MMNWNLSALMLLGLLGASGCSDSTTPTSPTTTATTSPVTDSWSTQLGPQGAVSRTVTAAQAGTIKVSLTSTSPGDLTLGLSVGIPRSGGSGCLPTLSVRAAPGANVPQVETSVAAGTYCVQVHDLGTIANALTFTLSIERP